MREVIRTKLTLSTGARSKMVDMTERIGHLVREEKIRDGRVTVYVPHTTAGMTINEHADPSVAEDILTHLDRMVPWSMGWRHGEGNSAAHIKASLVGSSVTCGVAGGALELGTWQGLFFCEFDGPRKRSLWVTCEVFAFTEE